MKERILIKALKRHFNNFLLLCFKQIVNRWVAKGKLLCCFSATDYDKTSSGTEAYLPAMTEQDGPLLTRLQYVFTAENSSKTGHALFEGKCFF